ncbi:MAG: hypothetical protein J6A56_03240 [Clostridia bacterium]|nr:hypothetical protein [Clostridia bacterium]
MKLAKVQELLDAKIHAGAELVGQLEVKDAFGSDLMSDVLAFVQEQGMLLTGLRNSQVVRTAEMMDMQVVVFVRGKEPDEEMVSVAEERNIVLMSTEMTMFTSCGILYKNGLGTDGKAGESLV